MAEETEPKTAKIIEFRYNGAGGMPQRQFRVRSVTIEESRALVEATGSTAQKYAGSLPVSEPSEKEPLGEWAAYSGEPATKEK